MPRIIFPKPNVAKKILREGKAHGRKLTKKQVKFFNEVIELAKERRKSQPKKSN